MNAASLRASAAVSMGGTANFDELLSRLKGVRRTGGKATALCPAHPDSVASLSIRRTDDGRCLLHCFAGCSYRSILGALELSTTNPNPANQTRDYPRADNTSDAQRTELARRIWRETKAAPGTVVESYLRNRGISIIPVALRFHPNLKHPSGIFPPAMVAGLQNVAGEFGACHRTWITDRELEPPRKMAYGPIRGCAVHLGEPADRLVLAEGIETGLSVQQATGIPTWAVVGLNFTNLELPACVRDVIIAADGDPPGEKAAVQGATRLMAEGRTVRIARPKPGTDFNDELLTT
jgi:putative DNA primase/helicase